MLDFPLKPWLLLMNYDSNLKQSQLKYKSIWDLDTSRIRKHSRWVDKKAADKALSHM